MPPGAPGTNSRGRGGKFKKFTRGGGKQFSRNLRPLDADGNEISMWSVKGGQPPDSDDDDKNEDDDDETGDDDDDDNEGGDHHLGQRLPPGSQAAPDTRDSRKEAKKARKTAAIARSKAKSVQVGDMPSDDDESDESSEEADENLPANPNHSRAARKQAAPIEKSEEPSVPVTAHPVVADVHKLPINDRRDDDLARLLEVKQKREEAARLREAVLESKQIDEPKKPSSQGDLPKRSKK